MLIRCKVCKKEFSGRLSACPSCGAEIGIPKLDKQEKIALVNGFVSDMLGEKLSKLLFNNGFDREDLLLLRENFDSFYYELLYALKLAYCDTKAKEYGDLLFSRYGFFGIKSTAGDPAEYAKSVKYIIKREKLLNILCLAANRALNLPFAEEISLSAEDIPPIKLSYDLLYSAMPVSLTIFLRRVIPNCNRRPRRKLTYKMVADKLYEKGYLRETEENNKVVRKPTASGLENGIGEQKRLYKNGKEYTALVYDRKGQELIAELLPEIFVENKL